ncbi:TPA: hypothetical protein ACQTX0_006567, partial [Pseudomonas aeruginosa]
MGEMKRYYSFFTSHPGDWRPCSKEHHDMARANPQDWPGYEVRELAVIPAGHVVVSEGLLRRLGQVISWQCFGDCRAFSDQRIPEPSEVIEELRALLGE